MRASVPGGFLRYRPTVDALGRFTALVQGPAGDVALDEAALLVAAHAHSAVDLDAWLEAQLGALDALAASCDCRDATELATALFRTRAGFGETPRTTTTRGIRISTRCSRVGWASRSR